MSNSDARTIAGFGYEWSRFTQRELEAAERRELFERYFANFPWASLPENGGVGADIGCGSGRWAMLVAPRVARLHLIDASAEALEVARLNLAGIENADFHLASVDSLPFPDESLDFAFSLGVLHHLPDTAAAIRAIAAKLKRGAPFLIYLYYAFDNRPLWYRATWQLSNLLRLGIARLPGPLRYGLSQLFAGVVYFPLARLGRLLDRYHRLPANWPLSYYRDASFYVMRTDALDRFGTRLERRFTRAEIAAMLESAGFENVSFSDSPPYWCAVAIKRESPAQA
ncbi:MAG: class I SAM-dependent methyltransferase [Candidatus Binatus sp.]|uniref:class I SAM-dependent methyltransferase n=1 Tax=Candidatus Binatus sp. TaxID=2811406 RepID=UPI002723EBA0|nr:class I SAM-dependent methyltransferase [Candidatus Binatus sp.]MDO8435050.1 class I SAM-dependent methyltransferase [Candidatus Binatus sp.]